MIMLWLWLEEEGMRLEIYVSHARIAILRKMHVQLHSLRPFTKSYLIFNPIQDRNPEDLSSPNTESVDGTGT